MILSLEAELSKVQENGLRTGLDLDLNSFWKCKLSIVWNVLINDIKGRRLTCFHLKMSGCAPFCSIMLVQLQICSAKIDTPAVDHCRAHYQLLGRDEPSWRRKKSK